MSRPLLSRTPAGFASAPPPEAIETPVVVSRESANQHLVLNSADRWLSGSQQGVPSLRFQPWNNFNLQKPQALMESFARRVRVCEVKFPWSIPNVNQYTNTLWLAKPADVLLNRFIQVSIPVGFYSPSEMVATLNAAMIAAYVASPYSYISTDAPVLSYSSANQRFTFTQGTTADFVLYPVNPVGLTGAQIIYGYGVLYPSLLSNILGIYDYQINDLIETDPVVGGTTFMEYTSYVDIISEKLNYYTDVKDGSSGVSYTNALVSRLYLADEISLTQDVPKACRPFILHRQFKNEKAIKWNPEAVVDWLDIRVQDQYGNPIPLPPSPPGSDAVLAYPDFQITLLASES
jgi:hypothetical protein